MTTLVAISGNHHQENLEDEFWAEAAHKERIEDEEQKGNVTDEGENNYFIFQSRSMYAKGKKVFRIDITVI